MKGIWLGYLGGIIMAAWLMAGCMPTSSWGELAGADPYIRKGMAEGEIQATQQAQIRRIAEATLSAAVDQGKTENEQERLMLPLRASQTALAIENEQAKATSIAAAATATAGAQLATATNQAAVATATQAVHNLDLQRRTWEQVRRQNQAEFYDVFWPAIVAVTVIGLLFIGGLFAWHGSAKLIELLDRSKRVRQMRRGEILVYSQQTRTWQVLVINRDSVEVGNRHTPQINAKSSPGKVHALTRSGSVLSSPMDVDDHTTRGLAIKLIRDAERVAGANSNILPSWVQLQEYGWTSEKWQRVKNALEEARVLRSVPNKGTYLEGRYESLIDLRIAIEDKRIRLRPVGPPPYSSAE